MQEFDANYKRLFVAALNSVFSIPAELYELRTDQAKQQEDALQEEGEGLQPPDKKWSQSSSSKDVKKDGAKAESKA